MMWIETLPYVEHYDVLALIVLGLLVEKHYVSRPSVFANTVALNLHFHKLTFVDPVFVWYANIGLVFGGIAIFSYAVDESLPEWFYVASMAAYSSIPVAVIILYSL